MEEHATAVVARLATSDRAPGLVLSTGAAIDEDVAFGANVVVHDGVVVRAGCVIGDAAVLGKPPLLRAGSLAPRLRAPTTLVEAGAAIGAAAIVCAGATS